jgi:hypothetical protein
MCGGHIEPAAILAALTLGGIGAQGEPPPATCAPDLPSTCCLVCLAESLHDAADQLEGMAERAA